MVKFIKNTLNIACVLSLQLFSYKYSSNHNIIDGCLPEMLNFLKNAQFICEDDFTKPKKVFYNTCLHSISRSGSIMDRMEIEEQSEEHILKDDLSEFYLLSLDIDIAFYGTKLKRTKEI